VDLDDWGWDRYVPKQHKDFLEAVTRDAAGAIPWNDDDESLDCDRWQREWSDWIMDNRCLWFPRVIRAGCSRRRL